MTLAYSIKNKFNMGAAAAVVVDVTLDASYTTGGYTLATGNAGVGVSAITHLMPIQGNGGCVYEWTGTKLKAWVVGLTAGNPLVEASTSQITTSDVVRCLVLHSPNAVA